MTATVGTVSIKYESYVLYEVKYISLYNQSFSAITNLILIYLRIYSIISFYLSNVEKNYLIENCEYTNDEYSMTEYRNHEQKLLKEKLNLAWIDVGKQLWPITSFFIGSLVGAITTVIFNFWALVIPICIVIILSIEIYINLLYSPKVTNMNDHMLSMKSIESIMKGEGPHEDVTNMDIYPEYEI